MINPAGNTRANQIVLRLVATLGVLFIIEKTSSLWSGGGRRDGEILYLKSSIVNNNNNNNNNNGEDAMLKHLHIPKEHEITLDRIDSVMPSVTNITKAIISPKMPTDDLLWIANFFPDWRTYIYTVNTSAALDDNTPSAAESEEKTESMLVTKNKGREASIYLTFIINNYHTLPDFMVFIHGRRYQWHTDDPMYDTVPTIANLRLQHVAKVGYASLRCTWTPGCPVYLEPDVNVDDGFFKIDSAYAIAFAELFPGEEVPKNVAAGCCAQFAVSKERVMARPLEDYKKYRKWLWDTELPSQKSGWILEYLWHIIFGKEAVNCIDAQTCFCDLWGHCDLQCKDGECKGRYKQPPGWGGWNVAFPEKWPEEGQGVDGWPIDGWWTEDLKKQSKRRDLTIDG